MQCFVEIALLTAGNGHPRRVESDIVHPKVQKLRPAMHRSYHGPLRQARGIIQRHAVEVADAHDDLERVAQSALRRGSYHDGPAQRAPDHLYMVSDARRGNQDRGCGLWMLTTVMDSTQSMKTSDVR